MKQRRLFAWAAAAAIAVSVLTPGMLREKVSALESDDLQSQIDSLESKNESIQEQLDELQQQHAENDTEIEGMVQQKISLDQQISLLYQQMRVTDEQIAGYSKMIADKQEELDIARSRLNELSDQNRERIRAMEEGGPISYWSVLFKANSFSDFLDRLNMVQEIAESDHRRIQEMNNVAEEVKATREALEQDKVKLEQTKLDQKAAEETLLEKREEADKLLEDLVARGDEYQQMIAESKDRINDLLSEIAQKEVERTEALQKEWEEAHPPTTEPPTEAPTEAPTKPPRKPDVTRPEIHDPEDEKPVEIPEEEPEEEETEPEPEEEPEEAPTRPQDPDDDEYPYCDAGWTMPVDYVYVSSPFSDGRVHPVLGYTRPHNGIDLAANYGNPVYAARSGYVTVADYEGDGAGNYVFINHGDGFSTVYMHLDHYIVDAGQYVSAGEVIGYVGTSGLSTGPHLHFGIAYNGEYYNPAHYIDF